jgi:hypothetical protein
MTASTSRAMRVEAGWLGKVLLLLELLDPEDERVRELLDGAAAAITDDVIDLPALKLPLP